MDTLMALPLTGLDWALLAALALSLVVGLVRGFVFECLSLAGWVVAWFAAQWAAPQLAPHLPVGGVGTPLNHSVALVLAFVGALIIWALLARLVRMLIHATPLSAVDRLLGAGFGALRGVVVLLALASVVAMSPAAASDTWRQSQGARVLTKALLALKPLLPESAARLLPKLSANPGQV
jgi:membrane protein required for colicin V production